MAFPISPPARAVMIKIEPHSHTPDRQTAGTISLTGQGRWWPYSLALFCRAQSSRLQIARAHYGVRQPRWRARHVDRRVSSSVT
jgi:hypothetical protein